LVNPSTNVPSELYLTQPYLPNLAKFSKERD
jgi:hypothetical protein